jgi:hypothetical protein
MGRLRYQPRGIAEVAIFERSQIRNDELSVSSINPLPHHLIE